MASQSPSAKTGGRVSLFKTLGGIALSIQNVTLITLLCHSRTMPLVNGQRYFASTAIFLAELIKLAFALSMALLDIAMHSHSRDSSTITGLASALSRAVFTGDSWKMAIPAMLYAVQNSLQYVAADNLDPTVLAATYQLKTVCTAVAGMALLGRTLTLRRLLALTLIIVGITAVHLIYPLDTTYELSSKDLQAGMTLHKPRSLLSAIGLDNATSEGIFRRSATYEGIDSDFAAAHPRTDFWMGVAATAAASALSGCAGISMEKFFKVKGEFGNSVWVRNVQLSFYTIWPTLFIGVFFLDGEHIAKAGFFAGYNNVVWAVVALQALGGILVACSINVTDAVQKNAWAVTGSVMTVTSSSYFLGYKSSVYTLLAFTVVLYATQLYSSSVDSSTVGLPPINVTQHEKYQDVGYPESETFANAATPSIRSTSGDALSTSRPGTPVNGRRGLRSRSRDNR